MFNKIETVTVTVSAHRDDSYRGVEQCARQQWADVLVERGDRWRDAGLHLVDRQPDTDVVGHFVYRFDGTIIECARRSSGSTAEPGLRANGELVGEAPDHRCADATTPRLR